MAQRCQALCTPAESLRGPVAPHRPWVRSRPALLTEALRTKLMRACVRPQACFSAACSSGAASRASRPHAPAAKSHPEACLKSIQRAVTSQVRLNSLHFHPRWHIKRRLTDPLPATGWTDQRGYNCSAYVAQGLCCAFPLLSCCLPVLLSVWTRSDRGAESSRKPAAADSVS